MWLVIVWVPGDSLVARIDVKSDRGAGVLRVLGAFAEPGADPGAVALEPADELRLLDGWLELPLEINCPDRGLVSERLTSACQPPSPGEAQRHAQDFLRKPSRYILTRSMSSFTVHSVAPPVGRLPLHPPYSRPDRRRKMLTLTLRYLGRCPCAGWCWGLRRCGPPHVGGPH